MHHTRGFTTRLSSHNRQKSSKSPAGRKTQKNSVSFFWVLVIQMTYNKAGNVLTHIPRAQKCHKTRFLGGVVWGGKSPLHHTRDARRRLRLKGAPQPTASTSRSRTAVRNGNAQRTASPTPSQEAVRAALADINKTLLRWLNKQRPSLNALVHIMDATHLAAFTPAHRIAVLASRWGTH